MRVPLKKPARVGVSAPVVAVPGQGGANRFGLAGTELTQSFAAGTEEKADSPSVVAVATATTPASSPASPVSSVAASQVTGLAAFVQALIASALAALGISDGTQGEQGEPGDTGPPGPGLPAGGTDGQLVVKDGATDYVYKLIDPPTAGASVEVGTRKVRAITGQATATIAADEGFIFISCGAGQPIDPVEAP